MSPRGVCESDISKICNKILKNFKKILQYVVRKNSGKRDIVFCCKMLQNPEK